MPAVEIGKMSSVETGQMPAVEAGQMSAFLEKTDVFCREKTNVK